MYKIMSCYDRVFRAIDAHEFPTMGENMLGFKCKASDLRGLLLAYGRDIRDLTFDLVYEDGSRQPAYFVGQTGANVVFVCGLCDRITERSC